MPFRSNFSLFFENIFNMTRNILTSADLEKLFNDNDQDIDKVAFSLGIVSGSEDEHCDSDDNNGKWMHYSTPCISI